MDKDAIYKILKTCRPNIDSKIAFFMADCIWSDVRKWHKKEMEESAAKKAQIDPTIQKFLDNPMSKEDEAKMLRATLHAGLASGTIPAPLLDKIDRIIGVNSGEDEGIQVVDFSKAFELLAESVRICTHPAEG